MLPVEKDHASETCRIEIRPLQYYEVPRAAKMGVDAMYNDSLTRYFKTADLFPGAFWIREFISGAIAHGDAVRQCREFTIDHGDAICAFNFPGDKNSDLSVLLMRLLGKGKTKEQNKRIKECSAAIQTLTASLGDRVNNMISITMLATSPEKQGRGYGTALVKAVTDIGDEQGRAVWLITSDAYRFYESVGFAIAGEQVIGDNNPKWDGEPVHLRIMVREAHRSEKN